MGRLQTKQRQTNLSGFIIPVVIAVIVVILIIRAFFGNSDVNNIRNQNDGYINISPNQEKSEIYIYMSGDSKKLIDASTKMYSTDNKLEVSSGEAKITFDGNNSKIFVNKLGEIKYNGKINNEDSFTLNNGDIWIEGSNQIKFILKNFTVNTNNGVFSFTQNMMASSVYVLKGDISLTLNTSNAKESKIIVVGVGQKITILNTDFNDENLKAEDKIESIDDFFKEGDFFAKHNGARLLSSPKSDDSMTRSDSGSGTSITKGIKSIIISYPEDESTIESNALTIEGKITSPKVEKVTMNDKEVSLDKESNTFIAKDFELNNTINNIVYKTYDSENNLLTKGVLTVYTTSKDAAKAEIQKPTVTTYPISSKDFRIYEPTENPYKTTDNIVKIAGNTNKGIVKFITINDFRLTKFPQFNSNWYYFANKDYGTMNDGINLYNIKYYGKDDELLYTSLFTIVKETITPDTNNTNETNSGSNSGTGVSSNG